MEKTESLFPFCSPPPNKVTSNRGLPFSHAINPYRGCEFGCRYCYARYTHEFLELGTEEFERKIYFKQNAAWLLEQELRRLKPGTEIAIGTATDPYQPLEKNSRSPARCSRSLRGRAVSGWES
jgi:DNA repair photolyase